jgi:hypothetical protein
MLTAAPAAAAADPSAAAAAVVWHLPVLQLLWALVVEEQLPLHPGMLPSLRSHVQPESPGLHIEQYYTVAAIAQESVPAEAAC